MLVSVVGVQTFNATRHHMHMEAVANVMTCVCATLLSRITHANLVPLSVIKCNSIHFILSPGHVEYELGVK